jgi:hypothetical protein
VSDTGKLGFAGQQADSEREAAPLEKGDSESPQQEQEGNSNEQRRDSFAYRWIGRYLGVAVRWFDGHDGLMTALATVVMAVFTGFLAKYAADQGAITERQLNMMERQIDAAERPWIAVSFVPIGPLSFDKDGGELRLKVTLKNTGHTPAVGVATNAEGNFPNTPEEILAKQKEICQAFSFGSANFGDTIFPNETATFEINASFSDEDMAKGKAPIKDMGLFRHATVGVCVGYKFAFDHDLASDNHHSGFATQLFRKDADGGGRILPDRTVPLSQLIINDRSRVSIGSRAD